MAPPTVKSIIRCSRIAIVSVGLCALMATACGGGESSGGRSGGQGPHALRVGYIADVHGGGLVAVANKQGIWQEANVEPEIRKFVDGPTQIQALAAGDLDLAYIGPGALWLPMKGQGTVVALDSLSFADTVITHKDISDPADLKGLRVGAPEGTSSQMALNLALESAGLTEEDINFVSMDPDTVVTAFVSGKIDAAAPFPPGAEEILSRVPDAHVLYSTEEAQPEYAFPEVWVARNDLVEENPEAVKAWLKAFALANDWRAQNLDKTVQWTAELAGTSPEPHQFLSDRTRWMTTAEMVQANEDGSTFEWFSRLNKLFQEAGSVEEEVDPAEYIDTELLKQVHEEMDAQGANQD